MIYIGIILTLIFLELCCIEEAIKKESKDR